MENLMYSPICRLVAESYYREENSTEIFQSSKLQKELQLFLRTNHLT